MNLTHKAKQRNFVPTGDEKTAVLMENVSSMELFAQPEGHYLKVLYDLSLTVPVGVCHGITGDEPFELQLVTEIMANVKPHEKGRCSLLEIGMMREKRRILPHVYYINDQRVLFEHMHVLGYLMFASEQAPGKPESKQREWLNLLLRTGLYPFTLTYIRSLNPAEYALVSALLAYRSAARLIVMDFSHIDVPEQLFAPMAALMQELLSAGKTVVLTSRSRELIQRVCQRASFLIDGTIVAGGSVHALCAGYDRRILTVVTNSAEAAIAVLKTTMPSLRARKTNTGIAIYTTLEHAPAVSLGAVVRALEATGVAFSSVNVPESSLEEAFQEVKRAL